MPGLGVQDRQRGADDGVGERGEPGGTRAGGWLAVSQVRSTCTNRMSTIRLSTAADPGAGSAISCASSRSVLPSAALARAAGMWSRSGSSASSGSVMAGSWR